MEDITYPLYYKCLSKAHFKELNADVANILNVDSYQQPLIDAAGDYWFIVNLEVSNLVDLAECVAFDTIVFPLNSI